MLTDVKPCSLASEGPSQKELRQFGIILGAIIAGLFGVLFPKLTDSDITLFPWVLATLLVITAILSPKLLKTVHKYWMKLGDVLSFVNTRIILGIVYYGMFVPIGFILRLMGKDPMKRQLDPHATTYRSYCVKDTSTSSQSSSSAPSHSKNMENPY